MEHEWKDCRVVWCIRISSVFLFQPLLFPQLLSCSGIQTYTTAGTFLFQSTPQSHIFSLSSRIQILFFSTKLIDCFFFLKLDRNNVGAIFTVRSVAEVEEGEELTLSYIPLDMPTLKRKTHLHTNWMFSCSCDRCSDPASDSKPIDAFCCPVKGCCGGLLVPDGEDLVVDEDENENENEERKERKMGKEGWCRICNTSAVLPTDRSMFRRPVVQDGWIFVVVFIALYYIITNVYFSQTFFSKFCWFSSF